MSIGKGTIVALVAGMLIAASTVSTGFAAAKPAATDVRFGMQDQATRFVVELSEPVGFQIFTLPDPYRVVIDMSEVAWRLSGETANVGRGVVSGFRYGLFRPGTTRIVLDVNKPVRVKRSFLLPPSGDQGHRFVLDLEPVAVVAREFIDEHVSDEMNSVGARVEIDHMGPTLIGMHVDITVTVTEVKGPKVAFEFEIHDELDQVGRGKHLRFVVALDQQKERLVAKRAKFDEASD